jgi:hypothetical protein
LNQAGLVKYVYVIQKCLRTIEVVRKWPSEKIVKVFRKNIFRLKLVMCEKQKNYYLTTILISEWFLQGCFLFELSKNNFFFLQIPTNLEMRPEPLGNAREAMTSSEAAQTLAPGSKCYFFSFHVYDHFYLVLIFFEIVLSFWSIEFRDCLAKRI